MKRQVKTLKNTMITRTMNTGNGWGKYEVKLPLQLSTVLIKTHYVTVRHHCERLRKPLQLFQTTVQI